ncbi:MAG: U32 family peptidase [Desulfobacterales bacterium]|jgi:collagenase-like PrtC family protease|nr:U32 family peptidase [Desulfobacterales bacterium]
MHFSVSTNWDHALLAGLAETCTEEVYGKLAEDAIGGVRPSFLLPQISLREAEDHVRCAHDNGLRFNYLINTMCLGNIHYSREGYRNIVSLLEWIGNIGVDVVTVGFPYMIRLVQEVLPGMKIKASSVCRINSVRRARQYEDLGVDEIIIDENINREFETLAAIRKAVSCETELIANPCCLHDCPHQPEHVAHDGHASQTHSKDTYCYLQYPYFNCTLKKFTNPIEIIRARWIRPEDLWAYEEIGYHKFKVVERFKKTGVLLETVQAYQNRSFDGNLIDILTLTNPDIYLKPDVSYFNKPEHVHVPLISQVGGLMDFALRDFIYIDNKKLDGFIEYFRKGGSCRNRDCDTCHHCRAAVEKAITFDKEQAERRRGAFESFITSIVNGDVFAEG